MTSLPIYRFHAQLADCTPAIWRRFEVPKNISAARLAYIVMTLFEMKASHLFSFDVPSGENYKITMGERALDFPVIKELADEMDVRHLELPSVYEEDDEEKEDAAATLLGHILNTPMQQLVFWYDFGDGWKVTLKLEDIYEDKDLPGRELPRVLEGAGYGIVEDCGGPGGLAELVKAMAKKKGPKYEEFKQWYELDDIDLTRFDLDDMNFRLKKVPRIYRDIYEEDLEPTPRSMDILTRRYLQKKGWHPA
jgi:hypothetical protein